jgi:heat shock protein HslJ
VEYGTETATLPRAPTAETQDRYSAGSVTFTHRGLEGELRTRGETHSGCEGRVAASPWMKAGMLGYDFRAVGQEPGWLVEIDAESHMYLNLDDGETRIYTDAPSPVFDVDGVTSYRAESEAGEIQEETCQDSMSGEEFPTSVSLRVGSRTLTGCGGFLTDEFGPTLDNAQWNLVELNGLRVDPLVDGRYIYLRFNVSRGQVSGFTGSNDIVGLVTFFGDQLRFRDPIPMTRMACRDSIAQNRERNFLNALYRTSRYTVSGDMLTLYSGNQVVARFRSAR